MAQLVSKNPTPPGNDSLAKVKKFWSGRTPRQRVYLGVAAGIMLASLALTANFIADPDYRPLMSGLDPADAQNIGMQLAQKKIPFKASPDGSAISVPADQVDAARIEVASHDTSHSGHIGFEIFDKVSWGQTEFDEKVNYQRALEGEVARTIQTMANVKNARVHLVMATDSVFTDRERGAKASVTLQLRRGTLSKEQVAAITRLISGAVDELKPADVAVIDADSNRPFTSASRNASGGDDELQQQLTQRLIETLSPVVGADHLQATVNVEYDGSQSEESQEKYDPAVSVPLSVQHSEESTSSGSLEGGVPGTSSNVPGAKAIAVKPTAMPGQSSKSETTSYGVNRVTRHVIEPGGKIRRLTAAVVVDDDVDRRQEKGKWVAVRHKRSPDDLKLIGELAQAAIGYDNTRGDVVSVQNLSFSQDVPTDIQMPSVLDKSLKTVTTYAPAFRYAALLTLFLLVYFLTVRPLQKRGLAVTDTSHGVLARTDGTTSLEPGSPQAPLAQRALQLRKQLADSVRTNPEDSTSAIRGWLQEDKA